MTTDFWTQHPWPEFFVWDVGPHGGVKHRSKTWVDEMDPRVMITRCGVKFAWMVERTKPGDHKMPWCEGCR
jgi:hypothetical protein